MKNILKYMKAVLACLFVSLAFIACSDDDNLGSADLGLGIKVFAPTHVVAGQPMTINGSGFGDLAEIEFPGGVKVSTFERVSNEMIRVVAPAGMPTEGGKIILHGKDGGSVESRLPLTIGKTVIVGYSKQPGEKINGLEELTIRGEDLLFVKEIILLDENEEPLSVPMTDFSRLAPNRLVLKVPNNIYTGPIEGIIKTFDGQNITMPVFEFEPTQQGGHWEYSKRYLWKNTTGEAIPAWGGTFRFSSQEKASNEVIASFSAEDWAIIKDGEFYALIDPAENANIRITTGWWSAAYGGGEHNCADMMEDDADSGKKAIKINIKEDGNIYNAIDEQHLLFTGDAYTLLGIYVIDATWIEGEEGHWERVSLWKNTTGEAIPAWGGTFRFSSQEKATNEVIASFSAEDWATIKEGTVKIAVDTNGSSNIRITTGWWSAAYGGGEHNCLDMVQEAEDGSKYIELNIKEDGNIYNAIDEQHLLFTGDSYTLLEIYTEVWVEGAAEEKELTINDDCVKQDDRSVTWTFPSKMTWGDDGRFRVMRDGPSNLKEFKFKAGETIMRFYKSGTGQIQVNNPNWQSFTSVSDWEGSLEVLELVLTQDIIDCFTGASGDGWSETALILQGDGLTISKITLE